MANVHLNIKNNEERRSNILYTDISMNAIPAKIRIKDVYVNSYKVGALSADNSYQQESEDTNVDYILKDTNKEMQDKKMYFFNDAIPSASNAAYNKEVRKRAHFKLDKNVNMTAIKQSLHNIFTWTPGERVLNPEFGTKLRKLLYEGITAYNKEQIIIEINRCVTEWEPRVKIEKVYDISKSIDTEHNTVVLEILYSVPSLSDQKFLYEYSAEI